MTLSRLIILLSALLAIVRGKAIIIEDKGGGKCQTFISSDISRNRAKFLLLMNLKTNIT